MLCLKWGIILLVMLLVGSAIAEEKYYETTEEEGLRFSSNQTVEGFGIASSYISMDSANRMIHSRSSGSGVFTSESKALIREGIIAKFNPGSFASNTGVGYLENASKAYSPTRLAYPGSFKSSPFSSLWSDSTILFAGEDSATALQANFDRLQALNKEMKTTASGTGAYEDTSSSTSFAGSMDLNVIFNGTGQIGAYVGPVNGNAHDAQADRYYLVDNYYSGAFTISNKMKIGYKATVKQEGTEWMPCCYGGWRSLNYEEKSNFPVDVDQVFNCSCIYECE
ncbi:MAG: hypothetical protein A4E49_01818 [Methanosaeta sp. PtaU1.Bin112]|nr:MAG: hypothetical protein A4E49_01818 [Methanosaeta sp. PtaU1.Bin112]